MNKLTISNGIVQGTAIGGVPFSAKIVKPVGIKNVRTGIFMAEVIGVTVHNTANTAPSADDTMHASWLQSVENADQQYISVHFFVDQNSITQTVPVNEVCFHAGDGKGDGNRKTISVEICENGDNAKAEANAKILVASLLATYPGIKVYKHQDWSGKYCPRVILRRNGWQAFVDSIMSLVQPTSYQVRVNTDKLNILSGPGTKYRVVGAITDRGVYTIVEARAGWGRLKSGAGWISLMSTVRVA